ncbi:E1 protein [Tree shrew papillomavirus 1]|uniref:Replication protein E1 n=1 Tax=Tree shrew papillomavirus 1 TaxID=2562515 RepID=A0AAE5YJ55_9PAPI|nr:E1 protein [Tree shrew papillomavirus 1]
MSTPGTDPMEGYSGGVFVVSEAECELEDDEELEELEDLFDADLSDVSDLIDNDPVTQGDSLSLFVTQEQKETETNLNLLKRKYIQSPAKDDLSPRLANLNLTPRGERARKRLFLEQDSGIENTCQDETQNTLESTSQVQRNDNEMAPAPSRVAQDNFLNDLHKARNNRVLLLAKFKEAYSCSFTDLTRMFKSDKTCNSDWVVLCCGVRECVFEAAKEKLKQHCEFMHLSLVVVETGPVLLMLLRFTNAKCRDTLVKLLNNILVARQEQLLAEPPNVRSVPAALFWYKRAMANTSFVYGDSPEWITKQTVVSEQLQDAFDLSKMVQWAYDNKFCDESEIAFEYAKLAFTDPNAQAWTRHNNQAKYVRDCCIMVRHYRRAEMNAMSIDQWIHKCVGEIEGEGDWKEILRFLRYQGVNIINFLSSLKNFFKSVPKKNCIVFYGNSNTGKSLFCMSMLKVLKGRVINFLNHKSHFWLQPLAEAKIALLDDATYTCWQYIDTYMRNALDGNPMSIDCKHKAPLQIRCPPLMITTNYNIFNTDEFRHLQTRVTMFTFNLDFPVGENNNLEFNLTELNWKSFFTRFWHQLDFPDPAEEDGEAHSSFRCSTSQTA